MSPLKGPGSSWRRFKAGKAGAGVFSSLTCRLEGAGQELCQRPPAPSHPRPTASKETPCQPYNHKEVTCRQAEAEGRFFWRASDENAALRREAGRCVQTPAHGHRTP